MGNFAKECDIIIGSDLLYFAESLEPLFGMVSKLFEIQKSQNLVFYMCMMLRGKEIHDALEVYINMHKD
jgi:hypothetical protein